MIEGGCGQEKNGGGERVEQWGAGSHPGLRVSTASERRIIVSSRV